MATGPKIEAAARAYARAYVRLLNASGMTANTEATNEVMAAQHDLLLMALDQCVVCQPGTCPGMLSGNP